jgi:hypothetical protein
MEEVLLFLNKTDKAGNSLFWIGLTDEQSEKRFVWASNQESPSYTNWNSGEPNNHGGHERCVHLEFARHERKWNDRQCNATFLFALCQSGESNFFFIRNKFKV